MTNRMAFTVELSGERDRGYVSRGARVGDLIGVFGALKGGDTIVRRGTDELREGTKVTVQAAPTAP